MRIATWNLDRPNENRAALQIRQMRAISADVWVLTETNDGVFPGDEFSRCATSNHDSSHREGEHWTTIWTRNDAESVELKNDLTRTACAVVSPPNRTPMIIYGSVLPWVGSRWEGIASADSEAFLAALAAQCDDWRRLKNMYPSYDLCAAGDFNQDLNAKHYYGSKAGKAAVKKALSESGLECVTAGDNDPIIKAGFESFANIDHICFNSDVARKCKLPAQVWPGREEGKPYLSDHFGVCVEVP